MRKSRSKPPKPKKSPLEFYRDVSGKWRWRTHARNGKVTADSAESYERRSGAERGAGATLSALVRGGLSLVKKAAKR